MAETHFTLKVLAAAGFPAGTGAPIVDLGCGGGALVRALRADGLDAYGCDFDFSKDAERAAPLEAEGFLRRIQPKPYRLPFDDASIAHVVSETVLEHVADLDETIAELARITRPDGATFHFFPARLSPIEPHVGVPFGGVLRGPSYLRACAALGFRKHPGDRRPAREVAAANHEYLRRGVHYLPAARIEAAFARRFRRVQFVEDAYFATSGKPRLRAFARLPLARLAYRTFRANVLLAAEPRR